MLQVFIVVFREIIEISLIIGILSAATKGILYRERYIAGGLMLGVLGSVALAYTMDNISSMVDGDGQEIFNGIVLILASLLITWTVIWMQKHSKSLSGELKALANKVRTGDKTILSLLLVTTLSVLREGSEIVLFTYGIFMTGISFAQLMMGFFAGMLCGSLCGLALYYGMMKIFGRYFFKITTWILVFLSCAILSQGVGYLVSVEVVPSIIDPIWDSSGLISDQSIVGKILNICIGYIDQPSATVVIAYIVNFLVLMAGLFFHKIKSKDA